MLRFNSEAGMNKSHGLLQVSDSQLSHDHFGISLDSKPNFFRQDRGNVSTIKIGNMIQKRVVVGYLLEYSTHVP